MTDEQSKAIFEAMKKCEGGHANLAFIAGICLGLSHTNRYDLDQEDRIYLAKASEYLKRTSFGLYYGEHGELP